MFDILKLWEILIFRLKVNRLFEIWVLKLNQKNTENNRFPVKIKFTKYKTKMCNKKVQPRKMFFKKRKLQSIKWNLFL